LLLELLTATAAPRGEFAGDAGRRMPLEAPVTNATCLEGSHDLLPFRIALASTFRTALEIMTGGARRIQKVLNKNRDQEESAAGAARGSRPGEDWAMEASTRRG